MKEEWYENCDKLLKLASDTKLYLKDKANLDIYSSDFDYMKKVGHGGIKSPA